MYTGTTGLSSRAEANLSGGNLLGRWTLAGANHATIVQAYFDHTYRRVPNQYRGIAQHLRPRRAASMDGRAPQRRLRRRLSALRRRRPRRRPGVLLRAARAHVAPRQRVRAGRIQRGARRLPDDRIEIRAQRIHRVRDPADDARALEPPRTRARGARFRARCGCRRASTPIFGSAFPDHHRPAADRVAERFESENVVAYEAGYRRQFHERAVDRPRRLRQPLRRPAHAGASARPADHAREHDERADARHRDHRVGAGPAAVAAARLACLSTGRS